MKLFSLLRARKCSLTRSNRCSGGLRRAPPVSSEQDPGFHLALARFEAPLQEGVGDAPGLVGEGAEDVDVADLSVGADDETHGDGVELLRVRRRVDAGDDVLTGGVVGDALRSRGVVAE